jgi:uncharacterized protein (UPF0303 family)
MTDTDKGTATATHTHTASLAAEAARLILPRFSETEALLLGRILTDLATARDLPVVISIRSPSRILYHAALPGSAPLNELWANRKSATAFAFHEASYAVGLRNRAKGDTLAVHGLSVADHADHGGAVPIRVAGAGVVAVATVSGLPQLADHQLVVEALDQLLAGL